MQMIIALAATVAMAGLSLSAPNLVVTIPPDDNTTLTTITIFPEPTNSVSSLTRDTGSLTIPTNKPKPTTATTGSPIFTNATSHAPQPTATSYNPGSCGLHVTQYQKNVGGVGDQYQFDVRVFDDNGILIGATNGLPIADFSSADIDSNLPFTILISAGAVDGDPVQFAYASHEWSTSRGCSTGGYGGGNRQIDCGFDCPLSVLAVTSMDCIEA